MVERQDPDNFTRLRVDNTLNCFKYVRKTFGSNNFAAQFINANSHYKKIGYTIYVLQQTACLMVNPNMVCNFSFSFNCMIGTSDFMMDPI